MKMRAAVYSGVGKIEFREVDKPAIGPNEILLQVRAAAICGTDLRIFKSGHYDIREGEERILGHELTGDICEVGSNVEGFEEGMRIGIAPNMGCGHCRFCRTGDTQICSDYRAFGIGMDGGFAEFVKIPDRAIQQGNIVPYDKNTPYVRAVLAEPLSCCYTAYRSVKTTPGDSVLIVGAGPMGALHLQVQRIAGARKVMMADISQSRLDLIRSFGADVLINTEREDLRERVMEETGGRGADVIITACPVPEIQQLSVELAAKLGRINLFGGLPKGRERVELNTNLIHYRYIVVTGTTGGALPDFELCLGLIVDGRVKTEPIISKSFKIEDVQEAFDYAMSGQGLKTVFEF
jgi:threonine dehydrogenase-like Zn-dependent dehydrogenase